MNYTRLFTSYFITALLLLSSTVSAQNNRLSQFEKAGMCDLLIDKNGTYHAVFQESPANGKPIFIYYASSANNGQTWSKPITISNDGTGNGSGYARLMQDGQGRVYAIWKRYGKAESNYPVREELLDGPGGYAPGTIFYKILNGGTWSEAVKVNESENCQYSWFPTIDVSGTLHIVWSQVSEQMIKKGWYYWYYADWIRDATISGNTFIYHSFSTPAPLDAYGNVSSKNGLLNLDGYFDGNNAFHMTGEMVDDNMQIIIYFNGKTKSTLYKYPKYSTFNNFNSPAKLVKDEKGADHVIFRPAASTLESEQLWDIEAATGKKSVIVDIQKPGITIQSFQVAQGAGGSYAVTFQAGGISSANESYGSFYSNGTWKNVGLTKNASKEKFFHTEFPPNVYGVKSYLSTLTKYRTTYIALAWDKNGKKKMLNTLSADFVGMGFSTSSPSIIFVPVE